MPIHDLLRSGSRTRSDRDAIVVEDLAKRYPNGTDAVRGISFRVQAGEVFGLLGPNGAGKSTTMGMLGTLVYPTAGRATVAGFDVKTQSLEVRRRIGFAMQEVGVDDLATGRELLQLHARLHGLSRREACRRAALLLDLFGIADAAGRRMGEYSGGMKRRVDLASAVIHLPHVLFLDEPTEGLDPHGRSAVWDTVERLKEATGHDGPPHHALHGGGGPALRSHRDRRSRADRARGHPARSEGRRRARRRSRTSTCSRRCGWRHDRGAMLVLALLSGAEVAGG